MSKPGQTAGPPEFEDSPRFHEREWRVQRVGWAVLILFLLAGASGLLGKGPLAHETIALPNGTLELDRFARRHAPTQWVINLLETPAQGSLELAITAQYISEFEITAITPEPERTELKNGELVFTFAGAQSGGRIVMHLDPQEVGIFRGTVRISGARAIPVRQIIYP